MWYPCLSYICLGFSGSRLHIHALFISWPFRPRAIEQKCPIFTGTIFAMVWCSVDGEWTVSTVLALSGGVAWPRPQTGHRHRHINIPRVRHCDIVTLWDIVTVTNADSRQSEVSLPQWPHFMRPQIQITVPVPATERVKQGGKSWTWFPGSPNAQ